MILHRSTWPDIEAYLKSSDGIVIPTGSTEQHGPTGMIGTDSFTSEAIAHAMADPASALVGPALTLGPAQFNLAFPGTVSLRPTTLIGVIVDYVQSLARHGFRHFYFLNGHGGNIAPTMCAFQELHADYSLQKTSGAALHFRLRNWWDFAEANELRQRLYGSGEGMHATPSELAITRALMPEASRPDALAAPELLSADFMKLHAADNHAHAQAHRARFPDGRVGSDSALGLATHGAQLVAAAAAAAARDYAQFLAED
ncbi:MAG: creatininase family protein [Burkholderiaceae bacterium]